MGASNVSAIPKVREFLFDLQRKIAAENDCIMDGRDIGTVVLPNADVKIFLTTSVEERANRRYKEMLEKGEEADYNDILEDIKKRDYQDSHREIAPLKQADDAIYVDNGGYNLEKSTTSSERHNPPPTFPSRGRLIKSQIQFALSVCSSFGGAGHSLSVTEGAKLYQTLTSPKGATRIFHTPLKRNGHYGIQIQL